MDETLIPRIVYGEVSKLPDAYSWFAKVVLKIFSGETAVFIFFVLSGTVLFQSLMRARRPFLSEALVFTVRRLLRIYPALIICLAIMTLYSVAMGSSVSLYNLAVNSALYAFPINGVTWTLNVEVVAVVFILAAYLGWCIGSEWGLLAVAIAIGIALRVPWLSSVAVTFKGFWAFFVLGMLIPTRIGSWIAGIVPMMAWPVVLLIVVIFKSTLQQGAIALLVAMLYYNKTGALGQVLGKPVAQFLGRISYSFYLYNFLVFNVVCSSLKQWPLLASHPVEAGLLASIPVIAITILLAYFSTRFVEVPGIEFGRALSSMPATVRQAPYALDR